VNDEAIVTDGQFSPDGHWIAYTSNESGKHEVYVSSFNPPSNGAPGNDIGSSQKSQISISGGRWPRWRRDGNELYYLAPDNSLTAVPVLSRGSALHFGVPHPLFHANPSFYNFAYDVSPKGNRFVINSSASEKTAPITLVQNWLSDFRK
jgi:hypothetical protein